MAGPVADVAASEREFAARLEASGDLERMRGRVQGGEDAWDVAHEFFESTVAEGTPDEVASVTLPFMDPVDVLLCASSDSELYRLVCDAIRDTAARREPELFQGGALPSVRVRVEQLVEDCRGYDWFEEEMAEPTLDGEFQLNESAAEILEEAVWEMPREELTYLFLTFCDVRSAAQGVHIEATRALEALCKGQGA